MIHFTTVFATVLIVAAMLVPSALAVAIPGPACPAVETFSVSTLSADGVVTATVLKPGTWYWVVAEGTWLYQASDPRTVADAEWPVDYRDELLKEYWPNPPYTTDNLDLMVDSTYDNPSPPDWWGSSLADPDPCNPADFGTFAPHVFSPSHRYILPVLGEGKPIHVWLYDSKYIDNAGTLSVSLHEAVPEPATLSLVILGLMRVFKHRGRYVAN